MLMETEKDKSAKLMEKAVFRALLYQLPIHGYLAVNMDGIPTINDTIGGVEVECIEDFDGGGSCPLARERT